MTEPLFLKPVFHEKIWGGRRLAEDFNYDIPDGTIGECWAISGHPHGPNVIENGEFKGQLLPDVYANHPEVFGNPKSKVFPPASGKETFPALLGGIKTKGQEIPVL